MQWISTRLTSMRASLALAGQALRTWGARQYAIAAISAVVVGLVIGVATVLIPNPIFARDIPPTWWDRPVWLVTSALIGMLIATYVQPRGVPDTSDTTAQPQDRSTKLGMVGGFLAWFAVGCPVCNKIALLVLGYSGAITWFAPFQPVLAVLALVFTALAVIWRLKGQVACTLPAPRRSTPQPPQPLEHTTR